MIHVRNTGIVSGLTFAPSNIEISFMNQKRSYGWNTSSRFIIGPQNEL